MCGIVGAFPLNKTDLEIDPKLRRQLALFIHNEILFETVARGKDATGVSASFGPPVVPNAEAADSFWVALKQPVDTADFFSNDGTDTRYAGQDKQANLERFMDASSAIQRPLRHIIGHTRAKTVGTEFNPLNNHPILIGKIIGIHNGGVKNYKKIYDKHKQMTPMGEVDSEVIMQLLAETANDRALTVEDITYVTERIMGPRAVIAYNRDFPEKVIYFHDKERPLELAYIEELGLAVICSERKFFHRAMHVYHRSSLTLKRNLPQLTVQWRDVPDNKGGIIDVTEAFEGSWDVDELFPLVDCADVLSEYDTAVKVYNNNTNNVNYTHNTGATRPVSNVHSLAAKKNTTEKNIPEAVLTDITKFGYDVDNDDSTDDNTDAQVQTITAAIVMDADIEEDDDDDDGSDDDGTYEESELNNINDVYDTSDLVKKGIEYVLSTEGQKDESLLINRHSDSFRKYLSKPLSEVDATEIVTQIYPDAFGEGFAVGFRTGAEEQDGLGSDDAAMEMSDTLEAYGKEIKQLKRELQEKEDTHKKAAAYIANMKAFLMAAMATHGLARVEGTGQSATLVFDETLAQFLATSHGFHKANPDMVKDIFNGRDLQAIAGNMVGLANRVKKETSSSAEINALKQSAKK